MAADGDGFEGGVSRVGRGPSLDVPAAEEGGAEVEPWPEGIVAAGMKIFEAGPDGVPILKPEPIRLGDLLVLNGIDPEDDEAVRRLLPTSLAWQALFKEANGDLQFNIVHRKLARAIDSSGIRYDFGAQQLLLFWLSRFSLKAQNMLQLATTQWKSSAA